MLFGEGQGTEPLEVEDQHPTDRHVGKEREKGNKRERRKRTEKQGRKHDNMKLMHEVVIKVDVKSYWLMNVRRKKKRLKTVWVSSEGSEEDLRRSELSCIKK